MAGWVEREEKRGGQVEERTGRNLASTLIITSCLYKSLFGQQSQRSVYICKGDDTVDRYRERGSEAEKLRKKMCS